MKTFFQALLLSAALALPATAQTNLAGTWQGRLEVAPGTTLAIHFVIAAEPGGGYSAVVTSPDSGAIKNVRAASVAFADGKLTVDVPALSGGYAGTFSGGAFEGEWSQEGAKLPLSLRPYETPTLTQADIDTLRGDWAGHFSGAGIEATIVLRFIVGSDGTLGAVLDVPEQGVRDWAGSDIALDDGHFSVKVPAARTEISGTLEGEQIVGQWSQLGNRYPLTLKKGQQTTAVRYLDLPPAAREQLAGRWAGTLGPFQFVVRFETDAQGRALGFIDIPQQNIVGAPITQAALEGARLTFAVAAFGAKYTGELASDALTGEWQQAGMPNAVPMPLKRD